MFAFLLTAILSLPESPLQKFQREAEQVLGKPIQIVEVTDNMGVNTGQTFCDENPVVIKLLATLDPGTKEQVLAHELGHSILCARGFLSGGFITDKAKDTGVWGVTSMLTVMIGSCYLDPLVDAEAERHGFKTDKLEESFFRTVKGHSREEVHQWVQKYGELSSALTAIGLYCADLRPHAFTISELEDVYANEPKVMTKLQALKRDLGKPQCSDAVSCFVLTKRLRNELGLQSLIFLRNPQTGALE
jgi:hypothetical protein